VSGVKIIRAHTFTNEPGQLVIFSRKAALKVISFSLATFLILKVAKK